MTTTPKALSALPECYVISGGRELFSAEQMHAYAQQAIADSLASAGGVDDWLPIALAQEDELCIVFWLDKSDPDHPERYEFDYLEEGVWLHHHDNYEHYMMVGGPKLGPGPSEKAPYTHFKRLHAPGAQSALTKEREVADGLAALLEEARDDVSECLNGVLTGTGLDRYERRIASYQDQLARIDAALTAHRESRGAASEAKEG